MPPTVHCGIYVGAIAKINYDFQVVLIHNSQLEWFALSPAWAGRTFSAGTGPANPHDRPCPGDGTLPLGRAAPFRIGAAQGRMRRRARMDAVVETGRRGDDFSE